MRRGRRRLIYPRRAEAAAEAVAEGTIAQVLGWVDNDAGRARRALAAERAGRGRSSLIAELERIARR
jgi:hypothetical protein